ncbi:ABC transporter ATP-binding protein [Corynebacterium sp. UMB10119B.1]|uniref:ABC transporter ATP-binding protein n=1 Tax=Corynebacterium sp. UMB10119B.1 TaxID=3050601 RepID=UPI00254F09CC|nr:ABC transporter ATP-binding protein [Corynebacterium sp. UMB10119B]MDK8363490.1 ABC transporter ATP-binding protein [Corynebacterium sp. UMB10119B]
MATGDQVIQAQGLGYKHATRPKPAFTGADLTVSRGERVLLTGDSGAGKSTLLAVLAGLAADGEEGQVLGTVSVNGTVGMVMQDPEAQTILTRVGDDVAFGAENMGIPPEEIWPRVRAALDAVGLDVPLDHNTAHLSGGQKQRLTLAGVLAMGADIILLDEPTANLDPEGRDDVVRAVDAVCRRTGATLIVVEHRPAHWVGFVDTFYHLTADGLQASGPDQLPMPPQLPPALKVPASAVSALRTENLRVAFGSPRNIAVPEGFSTVITGKNGVGKTTLVQALAGLVAPLSGTLEYSPRIRSGLTTPSHRWKSKDLAQRIGYVFQEPEHQFVTANVRDEVALSGASAHRVDELLQRLKLEHVVAANPFTLSGGEKRRLSVATALVNAPELLILDEPTFGQDDKTFVEVVSLIRELANEGKTIISITHDEAFVSSLGDHMEELRNETNAEGGVRE